MTSAPAPMDSHERLRIERARPPDWVNPAPAERYNLVVLGGGTAGLVSAAGAAGLGARVALVERGLLGGDCLHTGCVPSKALLAAARAVVDARGAGRFGVRSSSSPGADFGAAMERMRRIRAEIALHDSATRFRDLGVDVFLGVGRFVARDAADVGGARLRFARAVIATGARPSPPPVPGLAEASYLTSETVFDLTALPPRFGILGAGPIGCELAQAFARFGAQVVLVEEKDRVLPAEDPEVSDAIGGVLRSEGVDLALATRLGGVERMASGQRLTLEGPAGRRTLEVDALLVATGRAPNLAGLGLEAAGIERDERGRLRLDDRLRTTNRRVYAAGDVVGGLQLTHLADAHARLVIRNALFSGRARASALTVPWCTYTDPEVARVGHDRRSAAAAGVETDAFEERWGLVDRARLEGEEVGFGRVLTRAGSDEIVGATIVGRHAGEAISLLTLAIREEIGLGELAALVHPYPTRAQILSRIADQYQRSRLGPRARGALERWMAWRR